MFLAIIVRIRIPCEGHGIAAGVLVIKELAITGHIKAKALSTRTLTIPDGFLDQTIDLIKQSDIRRVMVAVLADQRPRKSSLLITSTRGEPKPEKPPERKCSVLI